ncbi:hypothetical protein NGRA_3002, partial [Nosema granulosis]
LSYRKEIMGFYEENFTKKYKALGLSDYPHFSKLKVRKSIKIFDLKERKIAFKGDSIIIYGLVDLDNFGKLFVAQENKFRNCVSVTNENPKCFTVNYIFKRDLNKEEVDLDVYDTVFSTLSLNKVNLQRNNNIDYKILIKQVMEGMNCSYKYGYVNRINYFNSNPDYQELKIKNKDVVESLTDDDFKEMLGRLEKLYKNNDYNFDLELARDDFITWIETKQSGQSKSVSTSEETVSNINYHKYFKLIHNYFNLNLILPLINLSYFLPAEIDDGPISIYRSLVFIFDDELEDVDVVCYDMNKKKLETKQKYRIFNKSIIIIYDDIEDHNIAFYQIKIGDKKTKLIDVKIVITAALIAKKIIH